jgi:hypothetical protein
MLVFDKLIEAIEFASDENANWWEEFGSIDDAKTVLKEASKCNLDEWEAIRLIEVMKQDYPTGPEELRVTINKCFSILKKQLINKK